MDWKDTAKLTAAQDQDTANALTWWKQTSDADKIRVWLEIQKPHRDPMKEILTRMAQIGMTHLAILASEQQ